MPTRARPSSFFALGDHATFVATAFALAIWAERASAAPAATPHTSKLAIFRGGPAPGVVATRFPRGTADLTLSEAPADVGSVRDVAPQFKAPGNPFGVALELSWSGGHPVEFSLRGPAPAFTSEAERRKYARNGFLVFDLQVLANGGSELELGVSCGAAPPARCGARYRLSASELAPAGIWRTLRIPLARIDARALRHGQLGTPAFVIENVGSAPISILVADVRWEAYPAGWSFAQSLAKDIVAELSLADKIGQLGQLVHRAGADADPLLPAEAAALGIGSLFGDSSTPPHDDGGSPLPDTPAVWARFLRSYQQAALGVGNGIPILFGMDAVHGVALVPGATIFPHNIGLGATGDVRLLERIAHASAREAAALGFRLTFAPTVAVARDERWGRTYESLSELPSVVGPLGAALTRGFQGTSSRDMRPLSQFDSVLACAKHFGGDGASAFVNPVFCVAEPCGSGNSVDRGNSDLGLEELIQLHLQPYVDAIEAGAGFVMSADSRWQSQVVTGSSELITGVLKGRFGFQGVVVTDYRSWAALDDDPELAMIKTLEAGNDLVMLPAEADFAVLASAVEQGVASGALSLARVDDAVLRNLQKKLELGLFDVPFAPAPLLREVGSPAHHALARRAVRQSLVLLKNERSRPGGARLLPLARTLNVYVAGKAADDIGIQSGGWTDTWQGTLGNALPGTTVLSGISELTSGHVVYSADATADFSQADVGVVVVGEYPYAEFCGDVLGKTFFCEFARANPPGLVRGIPDLPLPFGLPPPQVLGLGSSSFDYYSPFVGDFPIPVVVDPVSDEQVVARVCGAMPCVVVLISGRPMFIERSLERADAFVAAWLPGAEGAGVADVLYAREGLDFSARLEHTWPRTPTDRDDPSQFSATPELDYVPQNELVGADGELSATLFSRGYGLRYR
jgi:beta-glucosidase